MPHVKCSERTHDPGISLGAGPRPGPRRDSFVGPSPLRCVSVPTNRSLTTFPHSAAHIKDFGVPTVHCGSGPSAGIRSCPSGAAPTRVRCPGIAGRKGPRGGHAPSASAVCGSQPRFPSLIPGRPSQFGQFRDDRPPVGAASAVPPGRSARNLSWLTILRLRHGQVSELQVFGPRSLNLRTSRALWPGGARGHCGLSHRRV